MKREDLYQLMLELGGVDFRDPPDEPYVVQFIDLLEKVAERAAAEERERLQELFMDIHRLQKNRNNYWHFAANAIKASTEEGLA